jgi:hypothetical protein
MPRTVGAYGTLPCRWQRISRRNRLVSLNPHGFPVRYECLNGKFNAVKTSGGGLNSRSAFGPDRARGQGPFPQFG